MPSNRDIKKILVIGSGPVAIGQGCELDLLACQAMDALKSKGIEVVFVDPNPAAVAADPDVANKTYIEPLSVDALVQIIEKEKPDAILPAFGGQTGLNLTMRLVRDGEIERLGVGVLGADADAIARVEDRRVFKETMEHAGLPILASEVAESIEEGIQAVRKIGFPAILRTAYTTGGGGSAVAYNIEEFVSMLAAALKSSPIHQVMVEKAVLGRKELEVEAMRDSAGKARVVACAESIDAAGVHTGDSTVVAPPLTLSAEQKKSIESMTIRAVGAIGVVGAAGVRFALDVETGDIALVGASVCVGPLTSLTSHFTGLPLGRIAAELAVGACLDDVLPASSLEVGPGVVAVKTPRFAFDRFPDADTTLNTSMKSIGEVVGIGGSFNEALQKAIRSLEIGRAGLGADGKDEAIDADKMRTSLAKPSPSRLFYIRQALQAGACKAEIAALSKIDPAFIDSIGELVEFEKELAGKSLVDVSSETLAQAKTLGYSDAQLAFLLETEEEKVRVRRRVLGIEPRTASIRGAEFYSTYGVGKSESTGVGKKVLVLGGGPNRIGQGGEFDYCRAHAVRALSEAGYVGVSVNANSAGVSTDPVAPGVLFLDPQTAESVLSVIEREKPEGVITQFAGQSLPQLSRLIEKAGTPILGTPSESSNRIRDRRKFAELARKVGLRQPANDAATSIADAPAKAEAVGYPLLARAARTVGGQTEEILYDVEDLRAFVAGAIDVNPYRPLYMTSFLEGAIEVGVDAISDGEATLVCGVMEYIEQAGVHPGDSACSLPPYSLRDDIVEEIKRQTRNLAEELQVKGLIGVQFAVKADEIYVLEVHPRASRTVPLVSKATGVDWAGAATRVMLGQSLSDQGLTEVALEHVSVKETVFPFARFANVDVVLGPNMKSTGEVMGLNASFGGAYIKAQIAAGQNLPERGTAFVSVAGRDKSEVVEIGRKLQELGFEVAATAGTSKVLEEAGVRTRVVHKIGEGRPDAIDLIKNSEMDLIINTPSGKRPRMHEVTIRSAAVARGIPIVTTMAGAKATLFGMEAVRTHRAEARSLQELR